VELISLLILRYESWMKITHCPIFDMLQCIEKSGWQEGRFLSVFGTLMLEMMLSVPWHSRCCKTIPCKPKQNLPIHYAVEV
jgi:hypothetical protein